MIDAFTAVKFAGNPCAVITRAEGLDDRQMQAIAREMNLSETAFVFPSLRADFCVRFFTPAKEIPLAGHPTVATMHALAEEGRIDVSQGPAPLTQETKAGILPVEVRPGPGGNRIEMTQAKPAFRQQVDRARVAAALGLQPGDVREDVPVQVVSTGTPQLMVPVHSLEVLRRVRPSYALLDEMETAEDYFSTHVFALESLAPAHRAHARHFLAGGGPLEDPVTGSATGAMAAYLWQHGLVRESRYTVEQGHMVGRPGLVEVEVEADASGPTAVRIAGTAVTVLEGTLSV